jgi:RNA polymerase sigma factor (sigma-70 family)
MSDLSQPPDLPQLADRPASAPLGPEHDGLEHDARSRGPHGSDLRDGDLRDLVRRAGDGDQPSWDALVARFAPLVWGVARGYRLGASDASDVSQTVWLRLVEHLRDLREPQALPGWLATTTRHECLRVLRRAGREVLEDEQGGHGAQGGTVGERPSSEPGPEALALRGARDALVWQALGTLSERCRLLLRTLAGSPEASYAEVSAALEMPIGSIGPTRSRCLAHLRRALAGLGVLTAD